ncbi:MAG TPA: hypothetical protein VGF81_14675 [Solirubrobacteraceae bacterium]
MPPPITQEAPRDGQSRDSLFWSRPGWAATRSTAVYTTRTEGRNGIHPFTEGENVIVKVDPDDPNVAMIFDHAAAS